MTDELERRLRTSLSGAALPSAPDGLRDALDRLPGEAGPIGTSRASRSAGLAVALTAVVVLALLAVWLLPGGLRAPGAPSGSVGPSSSPTTGMGSPSPGASTTTAVSLSANETTIAIPLGGSHKVIVTIDDQSGLLTDTRSLASPLAHAAASQLPASYGDLDIAAWNPGGQPSREVWLYWGGVICDVTSRMVIGPGATSIIVTEGPWPACDLSNDGRGLVLTFNAPIDASAIVVAFDRAQSTP